MSFCGQCGTRVFGAFCGECGARTILHPDEANPARQQVAPASAPAPAFVESQGSGAEARDDTQVIPLGSPDTTEPTVATPWVEVSPTRDEDLPWVPRSLARSEGPDAARPLPPPVPATRTGRAGRGWVITAVALVSVLATATIAAAAVSLGWVDRLRGDSQSDVRAVATAPASPTAEATPSLSSPQASTTPQDSPSETPTTTTPTTPSEEDLRLRANDELESIVAQDARLNPVRGQWVAQLASKYEGVVDPSQQAEPFDLQDILDEVTRLRSDPAFGDLVRVVHQGDWGGSEPGSSTMWVTFADIDASSREQVVAWCESRFAQRGEALLNICYPRELRLR